MSPARRWALLLVLAGAALPLAAQAAPDPASWLGLTPGAVYQLRGAPAEVFPQALGDQRWQVVHYYEDHTYLYWNQNHVWQVRLDRLWTGGWNGLAMGMTRADAGAVLGPPVAEADTWAVWVLPYQTFPRKLRLIFTDGLLADAYLYRSEL